MKIHYISLGSFCHPKILIRKTNREISESLPFDFHSSPNTYSIYNILNQLALHKEYVPKFKEIIFTHRHNIENTDQLAVKELNDIFFLHFFDTDDLEYIPEKYPVDSNIIKKDKVDEVTLKFTKRFKKLYEIMNSPDDILIFLRIENYDNISWKNDLKNLCGAINKFKNPNKYLIYSQNLVDEEYHFDNTKVLNYDFNLPTMIIKEFFDENIQNKYKDNFLNVLTTLEYIITNSVTFVINDVKYKYFLDEKKNRFYRLNDINIYFDLISISDDKKQISVYEKNKAVIYYLEEDYFIRNN
tara:strand:- start:590 stop:1486 length:897 start_codon:yes stop_codon:yes gene_type:complete